MNTADRRAEIINILLVRRRITAKELADEFHVTVRTIQNDIQALSLVILCQEKVQIKNDFFPSCQHT